MASPIFLSNSSMFLLLPFPNKFFGLVLLLFSGGLLLVAPCFGVELEQMQFRRWQMADDPHRPGYHFLPPDNWMDDANGVIQVAGQYHLFYQWIPRSAHRNGGPFHWGHAVSDDLLHWRDLPIAISPTANGPDASGCWSGSAVVHDGVPTILYTGRGPEGFGVCLATSDDEMIRWKKHPANPVIHQVPAGYESTGGDPHVWQENNSWYCLMGTGIKDVGGAALLYKSKNLTDWDFVGPLLVGRKEETGPGWELPKMISLSDKHFLTTSLYNTWKSIYFVGRYQDHRLIPDLYADLDYGGHFYAPYTFVDSRERRIMIGWAWEGRHEDDFVPAGWSGVHTVARVVRLREDGTLGYDPIEEIESLRRKHWKTSARKIAVGEAEMHQHARGDMLEITAKIVPWQSDSVGVIVRASPDGKEQTRIVFDCTAETLSVDRTRASLDPTVHQHVYRSKLISKINGGAFRLATGEMLTLRIFVDRSIIEVYANGRMCLTSRVYPTRTDSDRVGWFATGAAAKLQALDMWQLESIWPVKKH